MHRTQTEFENQLIFKVFIFQFVNFYSSIIYIGFFTVFAAGARHAISTRRATPWRRASPEVALSASE